jgi:hypothetical protein
MQLVLHIGLPKTATTTIQHVLESLKPELAARGVLYPGTTRSQLELVQRSQFRQTERQTGPGSLAEAMGWLADEVRAVGPERVILSCERMSLVTPGSVARLQEAVATWLPQVRDVRVLAYVRDPVSWATSLCQQRLKQGTTRLSRFAADPWPLGLEALLGKYVRRYGRDAVTVRHLHPAYLTGGNVVDDFLAAVGPAGFVAPGPPPVLNRSLTRHGAQVADLLAELLPRGQREGLRKHTLRRLLQAIEGPRFVLPREVQARIVAASQGDVDYVRRLWGLDLRPTLVEPPDDPDLEEAAVLALALDVVEQVKRVVVEDEGPQDDDGS